MMRFLAALSFLTIVPVRLRDDAFPSLVARSVWWFPVVGLLIGCWCAGVWSLIDPLLSPTAEAVVGTALLAVAHGGLHLDGLADTADGFAAPVDRVHALEIMRDSRIGTFGVLALVLGLGLKAAAIGDMPEECVPWALVVAAVSGRCAVLCVSAILPPARDEGLGRLFADACGWKTLVYAVVIVFGIGFAGLGVRGTAAASAAVVGTGIWAAIAYRRLGGFTGDVLGAASELAEMIVLVTCAVP
ncbi:adenosylcobinamide-GDP ribazoletransferase [Thermostilla marina]